MCRKWKGLQGQLPPDSTRAEASGKKSGRRLIQQSCWGSKCTCLPPLQRGRSHNHVWVTSCEWLNYVTKRLKCKVSFTVVCKEMLSLTEFLRFLLFVGWPTASFLRKQATSNQEGEILGSKTKHWLHWILHSSVYMFLSAQLCLSYRLSRGTSELHFSICILHFCCKQTLRRQKVSALTRFLTSYVTPIFNCIWLFSEWQ